MFDRVKEEISTDKLETLPQYVFDKLFAWRTRTNCDMCFYQRNYEWVGLYEHYPEIFAERAKMEEEVGAKGFTLNPTYSMHEIVKRADLIKEKRAKQIIKYLRTGESKLVEKQFISSCGSLCGK